MIVPVSFVGGVPVPVMHIVGVIIVLDGEVAAALAVRMLMLGVHSMSVPCALISVVTMRAVHVRVVRVINVIFVRERHVPAIRAVRMRMIGVRPVPSLGSHDLSSRSCVPRYAAWRPMACQARSGLRYAVRAGSARGGCGGRQRLVTGRSARPAGGELDFA